MKKFSFLVLLMTICLMLNAYSFTVDAETVSLKVYNWQDYIDDGTDDDGNIVSTPVIDMFRWNSIVIPILHFVGINVGHIIFITPNTDIDF